MWQVHQSYENHALSLPVSPALPLPRRNRSTSSDSISSDASLPLVRAGLIGARTGTLRSTWNATDTSPPDIERTLYTDRRQKAMLQLTEASTGSWGFLRSQSATIPVRFETGYAGIDICETESDPQACELSISQERPLTPISEPTATGRRTLAGFTKSIIIRLDSSGPVSSACQLSCYPG